jgi:hypothetical protein
LPEASATLKVAVLGFGEVVSVIAGENSTPIVQLEPAATVVAHVPGLVLERWKSLDAMPEAVLAKVIPLIFKLGFPAGLVSVTNWTTLVEPMAMGTAELPKVNDAGSTATGNQPVPLRVTARLAAGACRLTSNDAGWEPCEAGWKATPRVQLMPGAKLIG